MLEIGPAGTFNVVMKAKMQKRVIFGSVMIVLFGAALYGDWALDQSRPDSPLQMLPTTAVLLLLLACGYRELAKMASSAGIRLLHVSGVLSVLALAGIPYWQRFAAKCLPCVMGGGACDVFAIVLFLSLAAVLGEQMARYRTERTFQQVGATMLAIVYLGLGGYFILSIRTLGVPVLVAFLVAVKFTDIGAYFTGSAVGKHKIIPWLSPGKSWEGLAGGLVLGAGASVLVIHLLAADYAASWSTVAWGLALGACGQVADMCESLLKRSASLKDSGAVVPEFGGVLDIIDSPLLAAPVAMILVGLLTTAA